MSRGYNATPLCLFGEKFLRVIRSNSRAVVNKKDRPNTTPMVRAICTFAVCFSVFRPFCRFTLVHEGHFILCYKEKTRAVRSC